MRDRRSILIASTILVSISLAPRAAAAGTYYLGPNGNDTSGNGTAGNPWVTLRKACNTIPDNGSEIVCLDGTYAGTQVITRSFAQPVVIRAEHPYRARLASSATQHRVLYLSGVNITLRGFEMVGIPGGTDSYLVQITTSACHDVVLENNILHDSYRNDIVKINDGAHHVTVRGNMFYNMPAAGDEHMDVNTVHDVLIEDNVFFNDFAGSGRASQNVTHPFVLVKNSGSTFVTRNVTLRRNVFLNWEGASDQAFLMLGEDGQPFHEAQNVLVENNLFLGNAANPMSAAFALKGAKDVTFRSNTIVGNFPFGGSWAYAIRLGREGANPPNENVSFFNNVWADPTGSMQRLATGAPANTVNAVLRGNLYYNGGQAIPLDASQVLDPADDTAPVVANPLLPASQSGLVPPRWNPATGGFAGGQGTIEGARVTLIALHGTPAPGSAVVGRADPAQSPATDILGQPRDAFPDLGAVEVRDLSGVREPAPDARPWLSSAPNPFRDRTTIRFRLEEAAAIRVAVYDLRGRRVRALFAGRLWPGAALTWDATDDAGVRVAAGVYWLRAAAGPRRQTARLIVSS